MNNIQALSQTRWDIVWGLSRWAIHKLLSIFTGEWAFCCMWVRKINILVAKRRQRLQCYTLPCFKYSQNMIKYRLCASLNAVQMHWNRNPRVCRDALNFYPNKFVDHKNNVAKEKDALYAEWKNMRRKWRKCKMSLFIWLKKKNWKHLSERKKMGAISWHWNNLWRGIIYNGRAGKRAKWFRVSMSRI